MKIFIVFSILLISSSLCAQNKSCCISADQAFAMFANDPAFVAGHAEPLPFPDPSDIQGTNITFACNDGKDGRGFLIRHGDSSKILFVFHEWWGLNDWVKHEAIKLSNDLGVTVCALDLYDGKVATTREEAMQYVQAVQRLRALSIIEGAYNFFGTDMQYATIGWCFGGTWSMQAAIAGTNRHVVGCVIYYGMPESDPEVIKRLNAPVLGIFAKKDKNITEEIVLKAKKAFQKADKPFMVHFYNADHGFANPSNPNYDSKDTKDAYKRTLAFLNKQFFGKKKK
jgi:carboxymethylenebutenolidase